MGARPGNSDAEAFWQAVREWEAAWQAFSDSAPEYLDYHIWRLKAAEEQLSLLLHKLRARRQSLEATVSTTGAATSG